MTTPTRRRQPIWDKMATPARGLTDAGPQLLVQLRSELAMDDEWTAQDGRSLIWWGAPLPLAITVDVPALCEGDPTVKITASIVVIENVESDDETVVALLADHNRLASVGTLSWEPNRGQVVMFLTHYSYEDNARLTEIFSPFALLAYSEALAVAFDLAERLGGRVATRPHPIGRFRRDFDELLTFASSVVVPEGDSPDPWPSDEEEPILPIFAKLGFRASGDTTALTAEFPVAANVFSARSETALFQLMRSRHPFYGNGMVVLLHLPTLYDPTAAAQLANYLNEAELQTPTAMPAFGAWSTGANGSSIVHYLFLPNYFARPGLLTTIAYQSMTRSRWAAHQVTTMNRNLPELTAVEPHQSVDSESPADWQNRMISYLADLSIEDVPSLEVLFTDAVASWVFSPANPGQDYDAHHGGQVMSALIQSVGQASVFRPERQPPSTPEIDAVRVKIATGANDIAAAETGFNLLVSRLMPAAVGELNQHAGDPAAQIYWLYVYGLFVLAGGQDGEVDQQSMRAIMDDRRLHDAISRRLTGGSAARLTTRNDLGIQHQLMYSSTDQGGSDAGGKWRSRTGLGPARGVLVYGKPGGSKGRWVYVDITEEDALVAPCRGSRIPNSSASSLARRHANFDR